MIAPPERIFATCTGGRHWVEIRVGEYQTEYIRADVAAAQIAERDARIAELEAQLANCDTLTRTHQSAIMRE